MDKNFLSEIDARIRSCLEIESKLEYVDSLLSKKKISKLEHSLFKGNILNNKTEDEVKREINNYIEKAVNLKNKVIGEEKNSKFITIAVVLLLIAGILFTIKIPALTGFAVLNLSSFHKNSSSVPDASPSANLTDAVLDLDNSVKDSRGNKIASSVEIINLKSNKRELLESGGKHSLKGGIYKVKVIPTNLPVKSIEFNDLELSGNVSKIVGIENQGKKDGFSRVYSIDPTASQFTKANVTITGATGNRLYKCSNWDFSTQKCAGKWELFKTISPGKDYTFELTPNDPGFAEIIVITKAMHLDSNRNFISDIYPKVKEQDNVWSETIPSGDYVRVRFEKNLTNTNDITIYPRTASGTPSIDVHEVNQSTSIAKFNSIVDNQYNKIYLKNLTEPQDTFDLLVRNGDVQFDHIIDPTQADPASGTILRIQECKAENDSVKYNNFTRACHGTYPAANGGGANDRLDSIANTATENVSFAISAANNLGGIQINSSNRTITDCKSITKVTVCREWWSSTSSLLTNCHLAVDANGGASVKNSSSACPGTTANPGVLCYDVTANESWTCSNFFGAISGPRAIARDQVSRSGSGGTNILTTDVLFFNVTYTRVPKIKALNRTLVANTSIIINWTTDFTANSTIKYGTSKGETSSKVSNNRTLVHNFTLTGLTQATRYFFNLTSCRVSDCQFNNTAPNFNFTTKGVRIKSINSSGPTNTTAQVNWTTLVTLANTTIKYGGTKGQTSSRKINNAVLLHNVSLSGLTMGTVYYYNVSSCQSSYCILNGTFNFTTQGTLIKGINKSALAATTAVVNWTTTTSSNTTIFYGTTKAETSKRRINNAVKLHNVTLTGLSGSTRYFFNVSSCQSNRCTLNGTFNFTTSPCFNPINQMNITSSTTLCSGNYNLRLGIDIRASRIKLVCKGTVLNGTRASINDGGILIDHVSNINISNCTTRNYFAGIYLNYSSNDTLRNNTDQTNVVNGIASFGGRKNIIFKNFIKNSNSIAIAADNATNYTITNNIVINSTARGISFSVASKNNNVSNNTILNSTTFAITLFKNSNNNTIFNNILKHNSEAFHLDGSHRNIIFSNRIVNNSYGVTIFNSTANILMNNTYANQSSKDIATTGKVTLGGAGRSNNTLKVVRGGNKVLKFQRKTLNVTNLVAGLFINNSIVSVNSSAESVMNTSANITIAVSQCTPTIYQSTSFFKLRSAAKRGNITICTSCSAKTCSNNVLTFNKPSWSSGIVDSPPNITVLILNSTHARNISSENLTVYPAVTDADSDRVTNITDWRKNDVSIMVLNYQFDSNINNITNKAIRDYSKSKNNGTLGGGTLSQSPRWTNDTRGSGGYVFDGKNDYIDAGNTPSLNLTKNVTMLAWINAKTLNFLTGAGFVVAKDHNPERGFGFGISGVTGNVYFEKGGGTVLNTGTAIVTNRWYFIGVTYDGTSWRTWLNGVNVGTAVTTGIPSETATSLTIGQRNYGGFEGNFNGTIDGVQIYNRTLSTQEILLLNLSRTDVIDFHELKQGEKWGAAMTPNDVFGDGPTKLSNNVTIKGTLNITVIQPNSSGIAQNIVPAENNVSISKNYSLSKNLTFNVTATSNTATTLTFQWFINKVLTFTQTLTGLFRSAFTHLFNTIGRFNVTVIVNDSNNVRDNFTFKLTTKNGLPITTNVILNSTHRTNLTTNNLTVYWKSTDPNNGTIINITDWRRNGKSIAILNTPFEANGTYNATSYSTVSHTLATNNNPRWNRTGGYNGAGVYEFDGSASTLTETTATLKMQNFTIAYWVMPIGSQGGAIRTPMDYQHTSFQGWVVQSEDATTAGNYYLAYFDGSTFYPTIGAGQGIVYTNDVWQYVVYTKNGTTVRGYKNGALTWTPTNSGGQTVSYGAGGKIFTIANANGQSRFFKGRIDELKIFNRTLSTQQITALYRNETNKIVSQELKKGDNWTSCITPNDRTTNGARACSNNVTVRNTAPRTTNVILNSTHRTNLTTDNLTVYWTSSDVDNDKPLINVTDWRITGRSIATLNLWFEPNASRNGTDYSSFKNNVKTVSGPTYSKTQGIKGSGAYKFDGSSSFVNVSDSPSLYFGSHMTIDFWMNATTLGANRALVTKFTPYATQSEFYFQESLSSGSDLQFFISNNGACSDGGLTHGETSGLNLATGKWYHVAAVYNGTASGNSNVMKIYVNGVSETLGFAGTIPSSMDNCASPIYIGGEPSLARYFNGIIDNVQIYNRTLSVAEILRHNASDYSTMSSHELKSGQNWTSCITPNDGTTNGATVCSNNVTVRTQSSVVITTIQPNSSGIAQNIAPAENNVSISKNYSASRNLTFNVTATPSGFTVLTFKWFINKVLVFTQVLTSIFRSTFTHLFNTIGRFNVTVTVNGSNVAVSDNFTFKLTTKNSLPIVTNLIMNSTHSTNFTTDNLTLYWRTTDPNNSTPLINITDWRVNSTSIALLNMPFEANGTSNASDYSTFKNHGKVFQAQFLKNGGHDKSGAYHFDGVNDVINISHSSSLNLGNNFTIVFWANASPQQFGRSNILVKEDGTGANGYGIEADGSPNSNTYSFFWVSSGAVLNCYSNPFNLTVGKWTHVAIRKSGTKREVFLNGTLSPSSTCIGSDAAIIANTQTLNVGGLTLDGLPNRFFNGTLDNVVIYNRSLTNQEIVALNSSKYNRMLSSELHDNETWKVAVTPNDGITDGITKLSNNVTVRTPLIRNMQVHVTDKTNQSAKINWTTNVVGNTTVNYGKTRGLGTKRFIPNSVIYHNVSLVSLTNGTRYFYNITACRYICKLNGTFNFTTLQNNAAPTVNNVVLNSTHRTNLTTDNLTFYWNSTDVNHDKIINVTDWRINGKSIMLLNLPFEANGTSNASDYSTNKKHGTPANGPIWNKTGGHDGSAAYRFDGINDKITLPSVKLTNSHTVSMWIHPIASSSSYANIFATDGGNGVYFMGSTRKVNFYYGGDHTSTTALTQSTWNHIVVRDNAGAVSFYINGVLDASTYTSGPAYTATNIGSDSSGENFKGFIDDIKVFNRSLSAQEILLLNLSRNNIIPPSETKTKERWQATITPNDGFTNGVTVLSNNVTIRNLINISKIFPNQTGVAQNISNSLNNISISRNYSLTRNISFNVTAVEVDAEPLTFKWFINKVLLFTQTLSSGFSSFFSHLFNTVGKFNITVIVNGSNNANKNFTFKLTTKGTNVSVSNVILNSTHRTNLTTDNLTVYWNVANPNDKRITNITDWRIAGVSIARKYIPFEFDGTKNATDYSTYNQTPYFRGPGARNISWVPGYKSGHALRLYGKQNSYVNYSASVANITGNKLTVMAWINISNAGAYNFIASNNYPNSPPFGGGGYAFFTLNNELFFDIQTAVQGYRIHNSGIGANGWTHVAAVYNGTNIMIYINGTQSGSSVSASGNIMSSPRSFIIGGYITGDGNSIYNGSIDDVRLYARALSPQQIRAIAYNRTNVILSQETTQGDRWSACITPNDGTSNGVTACSNNLTIIPPGIYNVSARNITNQSARVSWNTVAPSNATLNFGRTKSLGTKRLSAAFDHNRTFVLTGLRNRTLYYYNVTSFDKYQNFEKQGVFNFTTNQSNFRPFVSNVILNSTQLANLTTQNLVLHWTSTDINNNTIVNITDWRVNSKSITLLNTPFDANLLSNLYAKDYSTNNHNVTVHGATFTGNGFRGGAYSFDGNYTNFINTSTIIKSLPVTYGGWVNYDTFACTGGSCTAFLQDNPSFTGYEIYTVSNTVLCYDGSASSDPSFALSTGKWYYILCRHNGTKMALYVNAQLQGTPTSSTLVPPAKDFRVGPGNLYGGLYGFKGKVDEVVAYNRSLSDEQILQLFKNRTDLIVPQETKTKEIWRATLTPNDGYTDGRTNISNNLTIRNVINISKIFPNQTGAFQSITVENNVSISRNYSVTRNITFNVTVSEVDSEPLTFRWFINKILQFTQTLTGFASYFTHFFNTAGKFNVTVIVNTSNNVNKNFTFKLTTTSARPTVVNVTLNSTHKTNLTTDNLTVYWKSNDSNGQKVINITDWRVNGKSIAVLNMPFENSSTSSTRTQDYSTFGRNASVSNAVWNKTGYVGGGYNFNGKSSYIKRENFTLLENHTSASFVVTFKIAAYPPVAVRVSNFSEIIRSNSVFVGYRNDSGLDTLQLQFRNSTTQICSNDFGSAHTVFKPGVWNTVALVYNGTNCAKYLNGVFVSNSAAITNLKIGPFNKISGSTVLCIGSFKSVNTCTSRWWNGSIDTVQIYNRTLSLQEIKLLNLSINNMIPPSETHAKERWQVAVTPNDGVTNGVTVLSNNVTIRNLINISKIFPNQTGRFQNITVENNISISRNYSVSRNITFNATAVEVDSETLTFQWFVNKVLAFTQTLASGFTSFFTHLFNTAGKFNVTVIVNASNNIQDNFTFKLRTLNTAPIVRNLTLNSTHRTNLTTDNLTVYWKSNDSNGQRVINITDWRVNGKSIAVLNMPFENDTRGAWTAAKNVTDYSTFGNNGTVSGAIFNKTGGHNGGGAYQFSGLLSSANHINLGNPQSLNITTKPFTVSAWINIKGSATQSNHPIVGRWGTKSSYLLWITTTNNILGLRLKVGGVNKDANSVKTYNDGNWHYVVGRWNGTTVLLTVDAAENIIGSTTTGPIDSPVQNVYVGSYNSNANGFNGTIDDVRIYNRSLSLNEIKLLNLSKDNIISPPETKSNERWQSCITPNDGITNGATTCSNNLTIRNSAPTITNVFLNATHKTNITTDNLTLSWNSVDANGDKIVNITDWRVNGKSIALLNLPFENDTHGAWTATKNVTDYSTYGNNGTTVTAIWNKTGGYLGTGAYRFNGKGQVIKGNSKASLNERGSVSLSAWIYPLSNCPQPNYCDIIAHRTGNTGLDAGMFMNSGTVYFNYNNGTIYLSSASGGTGSASIALNQWNYVITVRNLASNRVLTYLNGVLKANVTAIGTGGSFANGYNIGGDDVTPTTGFNGTIDDVRIYNRSLSLNEINLLNLSKNNIIHSDETKAKERWQATITPNDGFTNGVAVLSNNVTIRNLINISKIFPNQTAQFQNISNSINNLSISRNYSVTKNITFNATAVEVDSETLTFQWFINKVLTFTQTLTSGFASFFTHFFNTAGKFNVTVIVNASNNVNKNFTFKLTTKNSPPTVKNVTLNSTHRTNYTTDNLTVYWKSNDSNGQRVINITDWRINGKSIALLNMQFEADGRYNGTSYTSAKQYNVTPSGGRPFWNKTGGHDGSGAYVFSTSGNTQTMVTFPSPTSRDPFNNLSIGVKSISFWVNPKISSGFIASTVYGNCAYNASGWFIQDTGNKIVFGWLNRTAVANCPAYSTQTSTNSISNNVWTHVYGTFNQSRMIFYINGKLGINYSNTQGVSRSVSRTSYNSPSLFIGNSVLSNFLPFNGTIDDVKFWNRSLSYQEILLLNQSKNNILDYHETKRGQIWKSCITPNDGVSDGSTSCSNNVTIRNSRPTAPTLIAPANGTNTLRNLNVTFKWTAATDPDNDPLTYALNLTSQLCANQYFKNINILNFTSPRLKTVDVCGPYRWKVRANDSLIFGPYSGEFNFSIQPFVNITLTSNLSDFGTMNPGQINDTTDENPASFVLESNSNVKVNTTLKALDQLWNLSGLGNTTFRFRANTTSEPNSFNFTSISQRLFTPVNRLDRKVITQLKFFPANNSAKIQFEIRVPINEPAGAKSANVLITGAQSG